MKFRLALLVICCHFGLAYAHTWQLEEPLAPLVKFMQYDSFTFEQQSDFVPVGAKPLYYGEDQIELEVSYLTHNLFENDKLRIYQHSTYNLEGVKEKYAQRQFRQLDADDFALSLGYGMEYQLHHNEWVGYEYLSSFPQDLGQSVRVFWRKKF